MALHKTRKVATYLRDGSLWVGHFVESQGELDFGDDRFDAAHGLAKLVRVEATSETRHLGQSAGQTGASKPRSVARTGALLERLRRPVSARRDTPNANRPHTARLYVCLLRDI